MDWRYGPSEKPPRPGMEVWIFRGQGPAPCSGTERLHRTPMGHASSSSTVLVHSPYGFNSPWPASGEIDAWECFMNNLPDEGEIIYSNLIFLKNSQYTNVGGQNTYREPGIPLSSAYRDIGFHWFEDPNNSGKITIRMLHNGAYYGPGITQDSFGGELSATAPFDQPFQLCMGIHGGIGWGSIDAGNGPGWPGDAWHGSEILVDRVRVYQRVG